METKASTTPQRTPWHLWLVGVLGLLWNSVGAFDFFMTQTRNGSYMRQFSPEQIASLSGLPIWLVASWAVAVWGGAVGSSLALLRKRSAVPVLLASLLGMVVTAVHNFSARDGLYSTAGTSPAFVLLIFGVALGLWLYARSMRARGDLT